MTVSSFHSTAKPPTSRRWRANDVNNHHLICPGKKAPRRSSQYCKPSISLSRQPSAKVLNKMMSNKDIYSSRPGHPRPAPTAHGHETSRPVHWRQHQVCLGARACESSMKNQPSLKWVLTSLPAPCRQTRPDQTQSAQPKRPSRLRGWWFRAPKF